MTTTQLFFMVVIGALLLLVGCGGSDSSTNEVSLTKTQFIKRGEEICQKAEEEQLKGATDYVKTHPGIEEEEMIVSVGLPPLEKEVEDLKALGEPKGDGVEVEAMLSAFEAALADARKNPGSLLTGEGNPFEKSNALAKKYGFRSCASNP